MSVIVVNAANWPNYVTLLRKELLDFYAEASGVEFWDATPFSAAGLDKFDFALWGHWPKRLGASPARVAGELVDRVHHLTADQIERLTIIMVFDTVEDAKAAPVGDALARATPSRAIVNELTHTFYANADFANDLRRVTWIAALRDGGSDEAAWLAGFEIAGPGLVGQGPLFDVAVFLDRRGALGTGEHSDQRSLTALRVLVDIARDKEAAHALLNPSGLSREGRVLVVTPPRPRGSPAERLRRDLIAHLDHALRTSDFTSEDAKTRQITTDVKAVLTRVDETEIAKAVTAASMKVDAPVDKDWQKKWVPTAQLEELWKIHRPPDDDVWNDLVTAAAAAELFPAMTTGVDNYFSSRSAKLEEQRKTLDDSVRKTRDELSDRVDAACVDPSFGLDRKFAGLLDEERGKLVNRLKQRSAEATAHRNQRLNLLARERPMPAARKLAGPFDALCDALERWLPRKMLLYAAALLVLAVLLLCWALVFAPVNAGPWPLLVCAAVVGCAGVGAIIIFKFRERLDQARNEAKTALLVAANNELTLIERVSEHGLAQVASARIAGAVVPFIETIRRHARAYDKLRDAMAGIENALRAGLPRGEAERDQAAFGAKTQAEVAGDDPPERFRRLLWSADPAPLATATVTFAGARGDLDFKSSLHLPEPVNVQIPKPPDRARQVSAAVSPAVSLPEGSDRSPPVAGGAP